MRNSDILYHTREYTCPNKECISHKDPVQREAKFFRQNKTYRSIYICCACGTTL